MSSQSAVDAKILADLDVVVEKLDLCESLLENSKITGQEDDNLLAVIGFLEACAPRMVELVEAAAQGALSENALMKCLEVNDRLTKQLEDVDDTDDLKPAASEATSSSANDIVDPSAVLTESAFPAAPMTDSYTTQGSVASSVFRTSQTSTEGAAAAATAAEDSKPPAVAKTKSEEEFDSFFNERTTSGGSS